MEREEGKIVVRTSHHWPHRSVETETSKLGKGEREGMETQDMGGGTGDQVHRGIPAFSQEIWHAMTTVSQTQD